MRVRIGLQVGEDPCIRVLVAELRDEFFELFLDGYFSLVKDGAEAAVVAVAATGISLSAVEVRATHAAVERELAYLEVIGEQFQK